MGGHPLHVGLPLGALGGQHLGNLLVPLLIQVAEGQVVQLPFDLPDAQPVGQGRVNIQGFLCDTPPFLCRQCVQGQHVMESVGQLDQNHPDVFRHGHQHLAQALGVQAVWVVRQVAARPGRLLETGVQPSELGNPVHQFGYLRAETVFQLLAGNAAVLHHIVQEGGHDGVNIQVEVGEEEGGFQRMGDVGVA